MGSLDSLMGLNESSAKLDQQLDVVCKKIERVALDTGNNAGGRLMFKVKNEESKYKECRVLVELTLSFSGVPELHKTILVERLQVLQQEVSRRTRCPYHQGKLCFKRLILMTGNANKR